MKASSKIANTKFNRIQLPKKIHKIIIKATMKNDPTYNRLPHIAHKILFQFSTVNKSKLEISEFVKLSKL